MTQTIQFCKQVVWGLTLFIITVVHPRLVQYTPLTLLVIMWTILLKAWVLFRLNDPILFTVLAPILAAAKSVGFDITQSDMYMMAEPFYWLGLFFAAKLLEDQEFESSARVFLITVCTPTFLTWVFNFLFL
jgi:hypothetical protein